jgi:hypothetical protein
MVTSSFRVTLWLLPDFYLARLFLGSECKWLSVLADNVAEYPELLSTRFRCLGVLYHHNLNRNRQLDDE